MNQMYAQVAEGKILKLNQRRGKIKGLGALSPDSTYISRGYYPITGSKPVLSLETHKVSGPRYEVEGLEVKRIYTVTEIPQENQDLKVLEDELAVAKEVHKVETSTPVVVTVAEGTYSFVGGEGSAGAAFSAMSLAEALGEPSVFLTDAEDDLVELSFPSCLEVASAIGAAYRASYFKLKVASAEVKKAKKEKV